MTLRGSGLYDVKLRRWYNRRSNWCDLEHYTEFSKRGERYPVTDMLKAGKLSVDEVFEGRGNLRWRNALKEPDADTIAKWHFDYDIREEFGERASDAMNVIRHERYIDYAICDSKHYEYAKILNKLFGYELNHDDIYNDRDSRFVIVKITEEVAVQLSLLNLTYFNFKYFRDRNPRDERGDELHRAQLIQKLRHGRLKIPEHIQASDPA